MLPFLLSTSEGTHSMFLLLTADAFVISMVTGCFRLVLLAFNAVLGGSSQDLDTWLITLNRVLGPSLHDMAIHGLYMGVILLLTNWDDPPRTTSRKPLLLRLLINTTFCTSCDGQCPVHSTSDMPSTTTHFYHQRIIA